MADYIGPAFGRVFDVEHRGKGFVFIGGKWSPVAVEMVGKICLVVTPAVTVLCLNQGQVFVRAFELIGVAGFENVALECENGRRPSCGELVQRCLRSPHFSIKRSKK